MLNCFGYYMGCGVVAAIWSAVIFMVFAMMYMAAVETRNNWRKGWRPFGFTSVSLAGLKNMFLWVARTLMALFLIALSMFYVTSLFAYHIYISGLLPCPS